LIDNRSAEALRHPKFQSLAARLEAAPFQNTRWLEFSFSWLR